MVHSILYQPGTVYLVAETFLTKLLPLWGSGRGETERKSEGIKFVM
jgi:hypothetical protein